MANLKAPPGCVLLVTLVVIAAALGNRCEAANITLQVVISYVEVDGNTSLPDPSPLNAFLRDNTSLVNPLFQNHSALQLQKCNASLYQTPFDFYTIQHPDGCSVAPGLVRSPEQDKTVHDYETLCCIWNAALFVLLLLCLIGRRLSKPLKEHMNRACCWLGKLFISVVAVQQGQEVEFSCCEVFFGFLWGMVSPAIAFTLGIALYPDKFGRTHLELVKLPNPESFNQVLAFSGQNVTSLYLCTIRNAFQVYLGFAESCDQVKSFLYPHVSEPASFPLAHGNGITVLLTIASVILWVSGTFIAFGLLYCCCFCPRTVVQALSEGCQKFVTHFKERKAYSVELQAPDALKV